MNFSCEGKMVKPSRKELKKQKEVLEEIRGKGGPLIDRYTRAKDPEMKWIKIREFAHVKSAFGLTMLMMEKYGEDAKELLAQFQWGRGFDHGKKMRERVQARGGDIDDLRELLKEYKEDFPVHYQFYGLEVSRSRLAMRIPSCHMGQALIEIAPGLPEPLKLPKYWCDYDLALIKGYNPRVELYRPKWIPAGDLYCEYIWELNQE
jgi:hypothetical protein